MEDTQDVQNPEQPPKYATIDEIAAFRSPAPLAYDYTHSQGKFTVRIEGITRNADRRPIYEEMERLNVRPEVLVGAIGYLPTETNIRDACWCEACITAPKLTSLQWLRFGAEGSLLELGVECLIASRVFERKDPDTEKVLTPDGVAAAEKELEAPLEAAPA